MFHSELATIKAKRADRRFEALLLASASIVWWTNAVGEFVEEQPYWADYTGQTWDEYRGSRWTSCLHPEDRDSIIQDWRRAVSRGSLYITQGRIWCAGHKAYRAFQTRGIPIRNETGEIEEWLGALTDVQDTIDLKVVLERAQSDLADSLQSLWLSEAGYRHVLEHVADGILLADTEGHFLDGNQAACEMLGMSRAELLGCTFNDIIMPEQHEHIPVAAAEAIQGGTSRHEWKLRRKDGTQFVGESISRPLPDGTLVSVLRDVTERSAREEQSRLLMQEAIHRNKNLVAVIQAMAMMTRAEDPADFRADFSARLQSLAASHDLMLRADQSSVRLVDLIHLQVDHFLDAGERLQLRGPDFQIGARVAQPIGMALHELATNAIKHGALSRRSGYIRVEWGLSTDGRTFKMAWIERGGPRSDKPASEGFGTRVIQGQTRRTLGGTVALDFSPLGFTWRLDCPAENVLET